MILWSTKVIFTLLQLVRLNLYWIRTLRPRAFMNLYWYADTTAITESFYMTVEAHNRYERIWYFRKLWFSCRLLPPIRDLCSFRQNKPLTFCLLDFDILECVLFDLFQLGDSTFWSIVWTMRENCFICEMGFFFGWDFVHNL